MVGQLKSKKSRLEAKNKRRKARNAERAIHPDMDVQFTRLEESGIVRRSSFVLKDLCVQNCKTCSILITPIKVECVYDAEGCCELIADVVMADGSSQGKVATHVHAGDFKDIRDLRRYAKNLLMGCRKTMTREILRPARRLTQSTFFGQ